MDYKKFAAGLRAAAGSYALFCGAPRGDLEKAADVIEQLAARLEPPNAPLTLEELRGMDRNWIWAERIGEYPWNIKKYVNGYGYVLEKEGYVRVIDAKFLVSDYGKTWLAYRRRPEEGTT